MRGDSMSKSLKQIQEFNRKKIICAVNGTENYQEALKLEYSKQGNNTVSVPLREYEGEDLTLDRVLIALKNIKCSWLYFDIENSNIIVSVMQLFDYDYLRVLANWELTKPTLEEQSEETQRAIYGLLGGENE
jgi:hypothetical protein